MLDFSWRTIWGSVLAIVIACCSATSTGVMTGLLNYEASQHLAILFLRSSTVSETPSTKWQDPAVVEQVVRQRDSVETESGREATHVDRLARALVPFDRQSFAYLRIKSLQGDLLVNEEQLEALKRMVQQANDELAELRELYSQTPDDDMRQQISQQAQRVVGQYERQMSESILLPHQIRRLRQLDGRSAVEQSIGDGGIIPSLVDGFLGDLLEMPDDQRTAMRNEAKSLTTEMREEIERLQRRAMNRMLAILTARQHAALTDLLGSDYRDVASRQVDRYVRELEAIAGGLLPRGVVIANDPADVTIRRLSELNGYSGPRRDIRSTPNLSQDPIDSRLVRGPFSLEENSTYTTMLSLNLYRNGLQFSDHQNRNLRAANQQARERLLELVSDYDQASNEQQTQLVETAIRVIQDYDQRVEEILLPHQTDQLRTLAMQDFVSRRGGLLTVLLNDTLGFAVLLSEEQKERIRLEAESTFADLRDSLTVLHDRILTRILSQLSEQQSEELVEWIGSDFMDHLKSQSVGRLLGQLGLIGSGRIVRFRPNSELLTPPFWEGQNRD